MTKIDILTGSGMFVSREMEQRFVRGRREEMIGGYEEGNTADGF